MSRVNKIIILVVLIIFSAIFIWSNRSNKLKANQNTVANDKQKIDRYLGIRQMALNVRSQDLDLTLDEDKTIVYGVVADWGMESSVVTTVVFATGDVSIYVEKGPIMIGGARHQNVKKAGLELLDKLQNYLSFAEQMKDTTLPEKLYYKLNILTNKGNYYMYFNEEKAIEKKNYQNELIDYIQNVITEFRKVTEDMKKE